MHFQHTESIGCELIDDETSWNYKFMRFDRKICLTHDLVVCRCGWQPGYHEGEDSKAMSEARRSEVVRAREAAKIKQT